MMLWGKISSRALVDQRLSAEAIRVLCVLAVHDFPSGCFPSVETIAGKIGCRARVVQYHLRRLEALGYIAVSRQAERLGGKRVNRYQLIIVAPDGVQSDCTPGEIDGCNGVAPEDAAGVQSDSGLGCNGVAPNLRLLSRKKEGAGVQSGCTPAAAPGRARASARPVSKDAGEFVPGTEIRRALVDHIAKASGRRYFDALSIAKRAKPADLEAAWAALRDPACDRSALAELVRALR